MKKILTKFAVVILILTAGIQLKNYQKQIEANQKLDTLSLIIENSINSYGFICEQARALLKKNDIEFISQSKIKKSENYEFSLKIELFDYWKNELVEYTKNYSFLCLVSSS